MKVKAWGVGMLLLVLVPGLWASWARPSEPYVQSGCDGVFYARCVPTSDLGVSGTTEVFRVRKDQDELIDHYDWFARGGIFLGWSPLAGKVGIMAIPGDAEKQANVRGNKVEFIFYLGGKMLRKWTSEDLETLGGEAFSRRRWVDLMSTTA